MFLYPADFPLEEAQVLVRRLRGDTSADLAHVCHAGWALWGFAQSQALPLGAVVGGYAMLRPMTETEAADHLEAVCVASGSEDRSKMKATASAVPWQPLALLLLDLVRQWVLSRQPGPQP